MSATSSPLLVAQRLQNQLVSRPTKTPAQVVHALGAMQAQDYAAALWAIGLRCANATEKSVEQAIADRQIVRSWPMRGTLHFVASADLRWMLALHSPRMLASAAGRFREVGLDAKQFARSETIVVRALREGDCTRDKIFHRLDKGGIASKGQRGYHILWWLSQRGVICHGPREGKQPAFRLLEEWIPESKPFTREESLAELARRYFGSHGPSTLEDFVWWSGLKVSEASAALQMISKECVQINPGGSIYFSRARSSKSASEAGLHLLPGFDEMLLGYADRSLILKLEHRGKLAPFKNGIFLATILDQGRVAGTWKREIKKAAVLLTASWFEKPSKRQLHDLEAAANRYSQFLQLPLQIKALK